MGTTFLISITGFTPNEALSFWITDPHGNVVGTAAPLNGQHPGHIENLPLDTSRGGFYDGVWAITFEGAQSHHQSIGRFRLGSVPAAPTDTPVPPTATTAPAAPTDTPVPAAPTDTAVPPTAAPAAPTDTPVPAAPTDTAVPPTAVPAAPIDTPVPPTVALPPTEALPPEPTLAPTEVPTLAPLPTETPMGGVSPLPGMPRTGGGAAQPWGLLLLGLGLLLAGAALLTRSRHTRERA